MKKMFLFLLLPMFLFGATGKVLNQGKFYEMRDSTFIIWTSRIHSDSTLDTLALINKDGIWINYANIDSASIATIIGFIDSCLYADSSAWSDLLDGYNEDYFLDTNFTKADSAEYADSSMWADLLDGYNEDYFRDTNDVWRDSVHAYQEATDSLATPKIKTDFIVGRDSGSVEVNGSIKIDSNLTIGGVVSAPEQWVWEYRVDTFALAIYFYAFIIGTGTSRNIQYDQGANRVQSTITSVTNGGEIMFSMRHLNGDSLILDSIKSRWYNQVDSISAIDTLFCNLDTLNSTISTSGLSYASVYQEDTITNQTENQGDYYWVKQNIGGYLWRKNSTKVPIWAGSLKEADNVSLYFYGLIVYYESGKKRYGIPE